MKPRTLRRSTRVLAILSTLRTFSNGMPSFSASSSGVGSRPISLSIWRLLRTTLEIDSIICTGMRMVRAPQIHSPQVRLLRPEWV